VGDYGHVMTAMVTPFDADGQVDYSKVVELTDFLIAEGSDSLLVCGTTGESPTLTNNEKAKLFKTVKEAAKGRVPVVAGTGTNNTATSVTMSKAAHENGADALLLVNPYYNKPPQEGLYRHFRTVAEATPLPVIIYNIPGRTGVNLETATLKRLAELPNVVAVKEASGSVDQVSEIARAIGAADSVLEKAGQLVAAGSPRAAGPEEAAKRFWIYSGDDSLTLPFLSVGATGVISVASHVAGKQIREMVTAFIGGDPARAAALHARLLPLFKGLFVTTNPILTKAALKLRGLDPGGLRLPLVDATEEQVEKLKAVMREAQIDVA